jgi:aspartate aminotransferase
MEESQTLALGALANKMKRSGIDICSLTAGEPDFPTPSDVKQAGIEAIQKNFTKYTANSGIPELLDAIAEKFKNENGVHVEPSNVLVSNGAKHSVYNALQAICNPGDEVIIPAPYWVSYPEMVKLVDGVPVIIDGPAEMDFKITPAQLRAAITPRTKAFIFNSPCNPTGTVYNQSEIEELAEVVRDHNLYVIADEIYEKIIYDGLKHFSMGSIEDIRDLIITINGVSKAFAMTGWRIGYLGASKPIADAAAKVQSQVTSNAVSISQHATLAALKLKTDEVARNTAEFMKRRDFMVSEMRKIDGLTLVEPKGAFYLFPSVQAFVGRKFNGTQLKNDVELSSYLLNSAHLSVVPGSAFGADGYLRVSYASDMKNLEEGVKRLKAGLEILS